MNSPADLVYQLLVDLQLGSAGVGSEDWPVFVSFLPDVPDESICVYDTAGRLDGRLMLTGEQVEHPGIQIRVRGKDYSDTHKKAQAIAVELDSQKRKLVELESGEFFTLINFSRTGSILSLGMEQEGDRRRFHFTINAVLTYSLS